MKAKIITIELKPSQIDAYEKENNAVFISATPKKNSIYYVVKFKIL